MSHGRKISVIGLGYVGLPVAVSFGGISGPVVAYDISEARISELRAGQDSTGEVDSAVLAEADLVLTTDSNDLAWADFHVVTVPTPIDDAKRPDFAPLESASQTVGGILKKGDIVVYESTVYPGATEEVCVPILEARSGLIQGRDFTVGYSPERINPGDGEHRFETIAKVVSGSDAQTAAIVEAVYSSVVTAGVHRASSIAVAEAAKVIENTQRDLNIALMNELALIFNRLGIDTRDVLEAAGTKWNFLPFAPGLVGGHCVGVDPYYLIHRAEQVGLHPRVIAAGRSINDGMGAFVARETVKLLMTSGVAGPYTATVLGITFKEDVPDFRNTKAIDVVRELEGFGVAVQVHDPVVDAAGLQEEHGLAPMERSALAPADAVVLAVSHEDYRKEGWPLVQSLLKGGGGLVSDVRGCLDRETCPEEITLWRL